MCCFLYIQCTMYIVVVHVNIYMLMQNVFIVFKFFFFALLILLSWYCTLFRHFKLYFLLVLYHKYDFWLLFRQSGILCVKKLNSDRVDEWIANTQYMYICVLDFRPDIKFRKNSSTSPGVIKPDKVGKIFSIYVGWSCPPSIQKRN